MLACMIVILNVGTPLFKFLYSPLIYIIPRTATLNLLRRGFCTFSAKQDFVFVQVEAGSEVLPRPLMARVADRKRCPGASIASLAFPDLHELRDSALMIVIFRC